MAFDFNIIADFYATLEERVTRARRTLGRALTLTEKVLYAHLHGNAPAAAYVRGQSYAEFAPDRAAMQDATGQMALLQFMGVPKPPAR